MSAAARWTALHSVPARQRSIATRLASHDRVQLGLLGREGARSGIGARDVARVAAHLGAGVDEHELAVAKRAHARRGLEHRRIRAAAYDRVEGEEVRALPEEPCFELDLHFPLGPPRLEQLGNSGEAGACGALGGTHPAQLELVLLPADVVQRRSRRRLERRVRADPVDRRPEACRRPPVPRLEPTLESPDGGALRVAGRRALPQPVVTRHRRDEVDPALERVEREHPTRPLAICEIEIFGVHPERVGAIRPAGHRNPRASTDQDELVAQTPRLGDCPPPSLQLVRNVGFEHERHAGSLLVPVFGLTGAARYCGDTMTRENVERLREAFDSFLARKSEWGGDLLDPEVEWDATNSQIFDISRVYHGRDGVREFWREWLGAWETVRFEYELVDAGNRVVALIDQRMRGRSTAIEVPLGKYAHLYTFRDGLIVHWKLYESQSEALEAAGLSEEAAQAD